MSPTRSVNLQKYSSVHQTWNSDTGGVDRITTISISQHWGVSIFSSSTEKLVYMYTY